MLPTRLNQLNTHSLCIYIHKISIYNCENSDKIHYVKYDNRDLLFAVHTIMFIIYVKNNTIYITFSLNNLLINRLRVNS